MLGTDVCSVFAQDHEVHGFDVEDFDIADEAETGRVVEKVSPSVILHTAAFTDVEACEDQREKAFRINVTGSMSIARASRRARCPLVYISTDYVFDGAKGRPYKETDRPGPLNYYGFTKLEGENRVREHAQEHLVVRTSWLFGPHGKNFVDTIIKKAGAGENLRVVDDQRGCPTYTHHLAGGLKSLVEVGLRGTVHMTNSGDASWFELAAYAVAVAGLEAKIEPVGSADYRAKARRPRYSVLASDVLAGAGVGPLPDWKQAVRDHLARRGMLKGGTTS
jgi:dTDP-4-dehydrorhamnose reductase